MKKQTFLFAITVAFFGLLLNTQKANAYVSVNYGEVPAGQINLEKYIKNPVDNLWVDKVSSGTYKFAPGEEIVFKLTVKNEGDLEYKKVKVTDNLPGYLELVSGNTTNEFENFKPDESREFEIKVKVQSVENFPDQVCLVNKAEVVADDQKDEDTAEFCLEKKVLYAYTQPEAGSPLLFGALAGLAISGLGILLKKKSQ